MEITSQLRLMSTLVNAPSDGEAPVGTGSPEAVRRFESALEAPAPAAETDAPRPESPSVQSVLHSLSKGELSHADLYQTQFAMSMLKIQGTGGSKGSQQLTQDVESLMKQQG